MRLIYIVCISSALLLSGIGVTHSAEGINCDSLPAWSKPIRGYEVNLHHVYCGEAGRGDKAKGFHAMPAGNAPSNYKSSRKGGAADRVGVYTLKKIVLEFHGQDYVKSFSSMFPNHCSVEQINNSIVYSVINSQGKCARPNWAGCGPSGPDSGQRDQYCIGRNGKSFPVASALLRGSKRINTGFPIYQR